MTSLINNLNKQLFAELTPIEAAAINGGEEEYRGSFGTTDVFHVDAGLDIKLSTFTKSYNNSGFTADIVNVKTGTSDAKTVKVGNDTTLWNDVQAGNYKIIFRDENDGSQVTGTRGNDSVVVNSGNF
jgi:hypothetical protein